MQPLEPLSGCNERPCSGLSPRFYTEHRTAHHGSVWPLFRCTEMESWVSAFFLRHSPVLPRQPQSIPSHEEITADLSFPRRADRQAASAPALQDRCCNDLSPYVPPRTRRLLRTEQGCRSQGTCAPHTQPHHHVTRRSSLQPAWHANPTMAVMTPP